MAKRDASAQVSVELHELAEAVQAMGNYLAAIRRQTQKFDAPPRHLETIDYALGQYARAAHAIKELRASLVSKALPRTPEPDYLIDANEAVALYATQRAPLPPRKAR